MEKQKRWQFWLIIAVLTITLYNILPTLFWYAKPLRQEIGKEQAENIAKDAIVRVNSLQEESKEWLTSFAKLIHVQLDKIDLDPNSPRLVSLTFATERDATTFRRFLPTAGALVPFIPAQLKLASSEPTGKVVIVERKIGLPLNENQFSPLFTFTTKLDEKGDVAPFYRELTYNRAKELLKAITGPSLAGEQAKALLESTNSATSEELALSLAREINSVTSTFEPGSEARKRSFAFFSQVDVANSSDFIKQVTARLQSIKDSIDQSITKISSEQKKAEGEGKLLDVQQSDMATLKKKQSESLVAAIATLKKNEALFAAGKKPLESSAITELLTASEKNFNRADNTQTIAISNYNPFLSNIVIDWANDRILLKLYPDIVATLSQEEGSEKAALSQENVNRLLFNSIATLSRKSDETIAPANDNFMIRLNELSNSKSLLALDLSKIAEAQSNVIQTAIRESWNPKHPDLQKGVFPLRNFSDYLNEKTADKKLGLVIYTPVSGQAAELPGFRPGSIYVIARGLDAILKKYHDNQSDEASQQVFSDFIALRDMLEQYGFIGYPGSAYNAPAEYAKDFIFELSGYYSDLLAATRENFTVKGDKRFATLEFTDVEQRMLAKNKIEDKMQEDLVKWLEAYNAAQVDLDPAKHYTVPAPTKNPYLANIVLSTKKYFQGDDRKILKLGLDLSGGKTVRVGLRDQNNHIVKEPAELNQAVNELYNRVNRMGVSERTIRTENDNIVLDFPGSQAFSASELIKASAMYFHILNEKFSRDNKEVAPTVNQFLQEVWNEAVVTNRKDSDSINEIAYRLMGGDPENPDLTLPRSESAELLYSNGLRLADPSHSTRTAAFDDTLSMVARLRGDEPADWEGQTHPLLIVFNNYALEGSSLTDIHAGYDPRDYKNMLLFSIKGSYEGKERAGAGSPQQDLYTWTSQFAQSRIEGTPKAAFAPMGYRMAVILNGEVVSAPQLKEAISSNGSISGRFTDREINQLAADLKAGSLSYTPKILSEQNVSPELGKEERTRGIIASLIAFIWVVVMMVAVYRFAGVVASVAVVINLLIMWGVLQSIGAALTLPGIAGIVLTIAMAVDANVLVFERIREEFSVSGRIASAIQAGYRKAFSAIIDSNLTTLLVALILIQFDSGPIKGFAVVIIIGCISSLFTALFMTRYYFSGWVRNPEHKELKMRKLFGDLKIPFLKYAKPAIFASVALIVIGTYVLIAERNTIFGMDFTGGYSLTVTVEEAKEQDYRLLASSALLAKGASSSDIQVRELSRPNQLRLQFGMSMEEKGHPFYQMPEEITQGKFLYDYQRNPRIEWVVDALQAKGLKLTPSELHNVDKNWTLMSGQLSDAMRNNAIIALGLALIGILVYITFRFELKYGVGAVVGLVHDVWISIGIVALFHQLGFPVEFNIQAIGALMMIIGYSLNDTIIVFDRIREEVKLLKKLTIEEVVNHSLNITLNRTMMTSGTTLLVLLSLVLFGGVSLFNFSFIMLVGILVGTLSSLFIASPVMLWVHHWQQDKKRPAID